MHVNCVFEIKALLSLGVNVCVSVHSIPIFFLCACLYNHVPLYYYCESSTCVFSASIVHSTRSTSHVASGVARILIFD